MLNYIYASITNVSFQTVEGHTNYSKPENQKNGFAHERMFRGSVTTLKNTVCFYNN
jgi:hypothetical protein